ncbi:hypothetical protein [Streptomyces sp. NPDC058373]|uniref:hypothetical protein n=1 Tax=Streptomyces sp. NPDC058373 TaxID=3346465 RepID=UPI003665EB94
MWALLQDHEPWIGHEESVYANKARSWTEGGPPAASWGEYRPPGLPLLGTLALRLNDDVGALRAVTLLLALAMLTTTYLVTARWTTPRRAVLTVLLVLSGLGFLRRMPEFLNDIGSTGLLLVAVFLLTRAQERPGSRACWPSRRSSSPPSTCGTGWPGTSPPSCWRRCSPTGRARGWPGGASWQWPGA